MPPIYDKESNFVFGEAPKANKVSYLEDLRAYTIGIGALVVMVAHLRGFIGASPRILDTSAIFMTRNEDL